MDIGSDSSINFTNPFDRCAGLCRQQDDAKIDHEEQTQDTGFSYEDVLTNSDTEVFRNFVVNVDKTYLPPGYGSVKAVRTWSGSDPEVGSGSSMAWMERIYKAMAEQTQMNYEMDRETVARNEFIAIIQGLRVDEKLMALIDKATAATKGGDGFANKAEKKAAKKELRQYLKGRNSGDDAQAKKYAGGKFGLGGGVAKDMGIGVKGKRKKASIKKLGRMALKKIYNSLGIKIGSAKKLAKIVRELSEQGLDNTGITTLISSMAYKENGQLRVTRQDLRRLNGVVKQLDKQEKQDGAMDTSEYLIALMAATTVIANDRKDTTVALTQKQLNDFILDKLPQSGLYNEELGIKSFEESVSGALAEMFGSRGNQMASDSIQEWGYSEVFLGSMINLFSLSRTEANYMGDYSIELYMSELLMQTREIPQTEGVDQEA